MARQLKRLTARGVAAMTKPGRHADGGNLYLTISRTASMERGRIRPIAPQALRRIAPPLGLGIRGQEPGWTRTRATCQGIRECQDKLLLDDARVKSFAAWERSTPDARDRPQGFHPTEGRWLSRNRAPLRCGREGA